MIVQKTQNENGAFVPDIPQGMEYKSATYRADTDDYLVTFSAEQQDALKITSAQGRVQLHRIAKKSAIDNYIQNSNNEELQIFWEYSTYWLRYSPTIEQLGTQFEIDLDQFFADAKAIIV
jgi:hypothetical protein